MEKIKDGTKQPSITVGLASRGCDIYYKTMLWLIDMFHVHKEIAKVSVAPNSFSAYAAQELLFRDAMKDNSDYFIIVDTDVVPPPNAISVCMRESRDILVAPVWHYDPQHNDLHIGIHYNTNSRVYEPKMLGVEEIISASFGFVCVSRKVLDALKDSGVEFLKWRDELTGKDANTDVAFFFNARKLGFRAYVSWEIQPIVHNKNIDLETNVVMGYLTRVSHMFKC